jgi:alpha-L-rhamnosidase
LRSRKGSQATKKLNYGDIVPPELRKGVMEKSENTIRVQNNGHFDTGMHGTYFLMKYLMKANRNDLVFEMTNKKDYPGWDYMLANGATISWESWTGSRTFMTP